MYISIANPVLQLVSSAVITGLFAGGRFHSLNAVLDGISSTISVMLALIDERRYIARRKRIDFHEMDTVTNSIESVVRDGLYGEAFKVNSSEEE